MLSTVKLTRINPRVFPRPMTDLAHIRNYSIVARMDQGESTLADRLSQCAGRMSNRAVRLPARRDDAFKRAARETDRTAQGNL